MSKHKPNININGDTISNLMMFIYNNRTNKVKCGAVDEILGTIDGDGQCLLRDYNDFFNTYVGMKNK